MIASESATNKLIIPFQWIGPTLSSNSWPSDWLALRASFLGHSLGPARLGRLSPRSQSVPKRISARRLYSGQHEIYEYLKNLTITWRSDHSVFIMIKPTLMVCRS